MDDNYARADSNIVDDNDDITEEKGLWLGNHIARSINLDVGVKNLYATFILSDFTHMTTDKIDCCICRRSVYADYDKHLTHQSFKLCHF